MKVAEVLERSGLSRGEARVYAALLQLGSSTTGPIAADAGVSSGKIYFILDRLMKKGLVAHVIKNKTKYYSAADPSLLLGFLRDKERAIKEAEKRLRGFIPQLRALRRTAPYNVQMFFGLEGIRSASEQALRELGAGDEVLALGVREEKGEEFNRLWMKWHRKRIKKKLHCRLVFTDCGRLYTLHKKMPFTQVRQLSGVYPATIDIMGDNVLLLTYDRNPACVLVSNREVAESFRQFFDSLWRMAE
ncbi:MAG: helix-turn-helix domain-containing protein [Candidatus Micrarchaeota archaeon]